MQLLLFSLLSSIVASSGTEPISINSTAPIDVKTVYTAMKTNLVHEHGVFRGFLLWTNLESAIEAEKRIEGLKRVNLQVLSRAVNNTAMSDKEKASLMLAVMKVYLTSPESYKRVSVASPELVEVVARRPPSVTYNSSDGNSLSDANLFDRPDVVARLFYQLFRRVLA